MKVLVIGGAGFLGSHIADALTAAGHNVIIFDCIESVYLQPGQTMIIGDVMDLPTLERTADGCDVVYHFAGIADIDECIKRPLDTAKFNVVGTVTALEAARNTQVKRFILASSVYVYSESGMIYRSSKQAAELFTEDYHRLYGLPYTILRYGSLYGERASEWNRLHRVIKEALLTGQMTYQGSGDEVREWIHVTDAARLSVEILKKEFENQRIIITGSQAMKYAELLEMIKEILGNKTRIVYEEKDRDAHYKLTPYLFNPKLGYKLVSNPRVDLGQGILLCVENIYRELFNECLADVV